MSAIIAKIIDVIPGLKLRASEEAELLGMDDDQHGEFSYDYVEVRRDFLAWNPQRDEPVHDHQIMIEPQHGIHEHAQMARSASCSETAVELKTTASSVVADRERRGSVREDGERDDGENRVQV